MVVYEDEEVFPAPPDRLWLLLQDHLNDTAIDRIHPLIRSQTLVSRSGPETLVDRSIDVRGTALSSRWKITYRPPEYARWEIVESEGPWSPGSYLESSYGPAPGGTRIQSHGELHIKVLPFFIPQKSTVRKVLDKVETEDRAYLTASSP